MPHDVIMPALGMAQETGKILAWLKEAGDQVSVGDPIMEVETDKAAMEVEAQASGYLVNISANAGDDVPVGARVAVIAETADAEATSAASTASDSQTAETATGDEALPDGKEIIMPALGMAQDTGLILNWHKAPGDAVSADETLLEVETDKAAMEVPAGHDGFIAAILAEENSSVPVGATIAIISAEKPDAPFKRSVPAPAAGEASKAPQKASEAPAIAPQEKPAKAPSPSAAAVSPSAHSHDGRILASPKAKWLAHQQGLDLSLLAENGIAPPYHVSDLETLKTLPARAGGLHAASGASAIAPLHVSARINASGFEQFIEWMSQEGYKGTAPRQVWLRFASAALRMASAQDDQAIVVELRHRLSTQGCFVDADRTRLSQDVFAAEENSAPSIVLRDFSDCAIVSATASASSAPVLTVGRDGDDYVISLDYSATQLGEEAAFELVNGFAERLADPLYHLL